MDPEKDDPQTQPAPHPILRDHPICGFPGSQGGGVKTPASSQPRPVPPSGVKPGTPEPHGVDPGAARATGSPAPAAHQQDPTGASHTRDPKAQTRQVGIATPQARSGGSGSAIAPGEDAAEG